MNLQRRRSVTLCIMLVTSTFLSAFVPVVSADSRIILDLSSDHVSLIQGDSANITLTIENNDTSIHDFDLSIDDSLTSNAWNVSLTDESISTVLPTFSTTTTIVIHLALDANLSDSGTVDIIVSHTNTNISSSITLYLSVAPSYLPHVGHTAVGDNGLLELAPGDSTDIQVPVSNLGSSIDHIVLAVDETADLGSFWANWSTNSGNNGGNNSGGNNSGGNNSGGNNSSNGTNSSAGTTELFVILNAPASDLTAFIDSVNLTANLTYFVDWTLQMNGSILPHDAGVYNWTSDGSDHSWNHTWANLSTGEWCLSGRLSENISTITNVVTCQTISSSGGNGTSMGRSVPSGWEVRWLTSTLDNMSAGESRTATLRISVPNGESPGDYGFLLSAGSAFGNFSISETVVIHVNGTHNLTFSSIDSNNWLPNGTGTIDFEVQNAGTSEAESIYTVSSSGVCNASLSASAADGSRVQPGSSEIVTVTILVSQGASEFDTCYVTFSAWDEIGDMSYSYVQQLTIGASHGLLVVSNDLISLSPGYTSSGVAVIRNTGTEPTSIRLSVNSSDMSVQTNSSYAPVAVGETIDLIWSTSISAETQLVGNQTVWFSVDSQDGESSVPFQGIVTVAPWTDVRMSGPLGGSFNVDSDSASIVDFILNNDGTGAASASLDWNAAPSGFSIDLVNGTSVISAGGSIVRSLSVGIDENVASGIYNFTIMAMNPDNGIIWDTYNINAHVEQRASVRVLVASDSLPVSNGADSVFSATIINDGNELDTFAVTLSGASGFEVSISPQTISLDSGQSGEITVTLRRTGSGEDVAMNLIVESENDDQVTDSIILFATIPSISVQATISSNVMSISAAGDVTLTLFLENLGEAEDTILVTGPSGFTCNHPTQVTLVAGSAASSHAVTCTASDDLLSGEHTIAFIATSLSNSSISSTASMDISISPNRDLNGSPLIAVSLEGDDWSLPWNSSATYTVSIRNDGNEQVSGYLSVSGEHSEYLNARWLHIGTNDSTGTFSVPARGVSTYSLTLQPTGEMTVDTINIQVDAVGQLSDGTGYSISSPPSAMTVEYQAPPPSSAALWEGGPLVDAGNLAIAMLSGWFFAGLLVMWMRFSSKMRKKQNAHNAWDEAAEEENLDADLLHGEIRADEDGTARCHSCSARIRLPSDKETPYRFKCPTCQEMNRVMPARDD